MSKIRILMADDEPMVLRVLRLQLEKLGYEVDTAPNGQAALEMLREQAPDVLITDIEMPLMSGKELCLMLAEEMPDRTFPIFVVTSLTDMHHRDWARSLDNLHFMEKPLSARRLTAYLEAMFPGESAQQSLSDEPAS